MPTNANIPPMDSFESDNKAFQEDKRVEVRDSLLSGVINPARGEDRVSCEQYDTHTWAPGSSGTKRKGCSPLEAGIGSEQFGVVPSKLA